MSGFLTELAGYWSREAVQTNVLVFMDLLGALLLGSLVGYERAYHGRAAGMRTYGLVCMASAGLTAIAGQPAHWFGGVHGVAALADPTRVMQGIVTGIGFLGAGVIVKEGLNISGLTTAASIWSASCIGILCGVGLYAAAILLTGLSAAVMLWGSRIEAALPSHPAVRVSLRVAGPLGAVHERMTAALARLGYGIAPGSFSVSAREAAESAEFVIVAGSRQSTADLYAIAAELRAIGGIEAVSLSHARN